MCKNHLRKHLDLFLKINHTLTIYFSHFLIGVYSREMKECPDEDLYTNVHSSFICETQTGPSKGEWIKKLWKIHTIEHYLSKKKECIKHGLIPKELYLVKKSTQEYMLYDSIYIKF